MATQTLEFNAATGLTISCKLFALESDTVVATVTATEKTNDKNRYSVAFTDIAAGAYRLNGFVGAVGGFANEVYDLLLATDRYLPRSEAASGGGVSSEDITAIKAKTDLITSQTANQQRTPTNTFVIQRGDTFAGTHSVTTDYTGYTATFTIRHRVTDAVICTASATVTSATVLTVNLTTTESAFALFVSEDEFGAHPYDIQLVNGAIQKTEFGVAIVRRDVTRT